MSKETTAYCYANGVIRFGKTTPKGAIAIATGPRKKLRDLIHARCRWSYPTTRGDSKTEVPLVPGIPEAPDQMAALAALVQFARWIKQTLEAA